MPNRNLKIEQNSWKTRGLCMGTCLWNLNSKSYWHCPITNDNYWPVPHGPSSRVDTTIIDPELTMAFLTLFLLLQVFNFDDIRYPQSVAITEFNDIFGTSEHQYCTALPFVMSLTSLSNSCALTLPLPSSHPLPSWHHLHQTPSLRPFRAHVVMHQIQVRQTGVLFQCLGQSLAGGKRFERHDEAHSTHPDVALFPYLLEGVPTGFDSPITASNCFPLSHRKKYAKFACSSSHSHLKMLVPGSKNAWNNKKSMGHQGYTALLICYALHF